MTDIYVIVVTPSETHVYELGNVTGSELDTKLQEIRLALGVPEDSRTPGWDLSVTYGEPHPSLMATAIVHRLL